MLSAYGKREWLAIVAMGAMLTATCLAVGWMWWALGAVVVTLALLSFFRDPNRGAPSQRNIAVAPADGKVSSVHRVEHFEPFNGPAQCVRIFLSVLDVHVNRCPCHAKIYRISHKPGKHRNALNPESAEDNESTLIELHHPTRHHPVAAVRLVAGMLARTIECGAEVGQILQRGERFGMIKLGSTAELYLPESLEPRIETRRGARVWAGESILATVTPPPTDRPDEPEPTAEIDQDDLSDNRSPDGQTIAANGPSDSPPQNLIDDTDIDTESAEVSIQVKTPQPEQPLTAD